MIDLHLIGIGTGNPDHLTRAAERAMQAADLILLPRKRADTADLLDLRQTLCAAVAMPDTRVALFDLPERVLPAEVLATPTPTDEEANRELVRRAARSFGVATVKCLSDYYRMGTAPTRQAVTELVEAGELVPVEVEGWAKPAWLHRDAKVPRSVPAPSARRSGAGSRSASG